MTGNERSNALLGILSKETRKLVPLKQQFQLASQVD